MENNFNKLITNFNVNTSEKRQSAVLGGSPFEHFDIKLSRGVVNSKGVSYFKLDNLSNTHDVRLMIDGKPIELPDNIIKEFAGFLQIKHDLPPKFDCRSFVNFLNSIPYANIDFGLNFKISPLKNNNELELGDVVFFSKKESSNRYIPEHFAIYIGKDIFLSTSGPGDGDLIASDIKEMKNAFDAQYAYRCVLRK